MIVIWHNPRCSKSRQTLALLKTQGATVQERRYLEDAPTTEEISDVLFKMNATAIDLIRKGETVYKEMGLSAEMSETELVQAMADVPRLIERPVVIAGDKACQAT